MTKRRRKPWTQETLLQVIKAKEGLGFYYNPLAWKNEQMHRIVRKLIKARKVSQVRIKANLTQLDYRGEGDSDVSKRRNSGFGRKV